MIVLLIVSTLIMKPRKSKIKHSWYGCSQLFLNQCCFWDKIHEHFSLHTKTRARQLHTAMRAVTLDDKIIKEYLQKIKGFVDELAGVGVPVHHEEYVDALLERLSSDYASVVSVIESKKQVSSIVEIEALLYRHET